MTGPASPDDWTDPGDRPSGADRIDAWLDEIDRSTAVAVGTAAGVTDYVASELRRVAGLLAADWLTADNRAEAAAAVNALHQQASDLAAAGTVWATRLYAAADTLTRTTAPHRIEESDPTAPF